VHLRHAIIAERLEACQKGKNKLETMQIAIEMGWVVKDVKASGAHSRFLKSDGAVGVVDDEASSTRESEPRVLRSKKMVVKPTRTHVSTAIWNKVMMTNASNKSP
jgi:hypothetical protein